MHHKFRENSKEPLKDATTGNNHFPFSSHTFYDSQDVHPTGYPGHRNSTGFRKHLNLFQESSFGRHKDNDIEENFKDERSSEFFHGFLAIGTLGIETFLDEPATPTFGDPAIDDADVTENDLKRISNELEKFLEAEANEGYNQPSGRNSDSNTIASTIEAIEGQCTEEDNQPTKFPLQEYLFGSVIEFPETKAAGKKKEKASLGELFQVTEMHEKHYETKYEDKYEEKYEEKKKQTSSTHKSATHLVKKVLKKLHSSSRSSASDETEVSSTKKKFQKMAQVFHRKVYPEDSIMENETYSSMTPDPKNSKATSTALMSENVNPCRETSKRWIQYELRSSGSAENREHWIKTDEDYFVLEL
ncbi:unnamed protein product [Cochlearia groenlandica]